MPHRLIIHCGLHKTGTTMLQTFLTAVTPAVRAFNILVPETGRIARFGGGHHNIAWELNRDRRFERRLGTVAALAAEIAAFDGDAIISSEDFETCLSDPRRFAPLLRHPALANREIVLVVYLRDQFSYAEGMFTENIGHGTGDEAAQVALEIAELGEWRLREWRFLFDFSRLLTLPAAIAPARLVLRIHARPSDGGVIDDFMGMLYPAITFKPAADSPAALNRRWKFRHALVNYFGNRTSRPVTDREQFILRVLGAQVGDAPLVLSGNLRHRFAGRFQTGNLAICETAGLPFARLNLQQLMETPPDAFLMDRIYSFETTALIAELANLVPDGVDPAGDDPLLLPEQARSIIEQLLVFWRTAPAAG